MQRLAADMVLQTASRIRFTKRIFYSNRYHGIAVKKGIEVKKIIHLVYEPACGLLTRWRLIDMDLDMDPHNLDLGRDLIR